MRANSYKILVVRIVFGLTVSTAVHAAQVKLTSEEVSELDAVAQKGIRDGSTTGVALGIMSDGEMIYSRAFGLANLETRTPATPDTVFRIASVTKQFTAASILLLAERGKLKLNDKLSSYLPDFPNSDKMTIYQLLTHTSGLKDYTNSTDYWSVKSRTEMKTSEFVKYISLINPQFDFAPGTGFKYSNSGFYLLGAVVEKVSGQSLSTFFDSELFKVAGMTQTAIDRSSDVVANRASGYERSATTGQMENAPFISISTVGANGAIRSTIGDLCRWHFALLNGKIVNKASLAMMLSPGRLSNGELARTAPMSSLSHTVPKFDGSGFDYGFGMDIGRQDNFTLITHGGAINGFRSRLTSFTDRNVTIAFLANTGDGTPKVAEAATEIMVKHLREH